VQCHELPKITLIMCSRVSEGSCFISVWDLFCVNLRSLALAMCTDTGYLTDVEVFNKCC
jgi:hypothetical protein